MNKKTADILFQAFHKQWPDPKCALNYSDAFSLLVSIVLSAQTTDVGVNKITPALFKEAPTPEKMLALGFEKLSALIYATGFYRRKAELLMTLCTQLITRHHGNVPHTEKELEALSGVGRKTANVFLNVYDGKPLIAVDRHVLRVSVRLGLAHGHTPEQVEKELEAIVPKKWQNKAAHWLVWHGRTTCTARYPKCKTCFAFSICENPLVAGVGFEPTTFRL